jgi:hypothetical protein
MTNIAGAALAVGPPYMIDAIKEALPHGSPGLTAAVEDGTPS